MQRRSLLKLAPALACAAVPQLHAQEHWPQRPLRMVVPFPPGGGTDLVARAIGQRLSQQLGQAVVIDNRPGASTWIGTDAVIRSAPDGYTLLLSGSTSYTVTPALKPQPGYDPLKDLMPVAMLAKTPLLLVVPASSPFQSLDDLLTAARARPGAVRYATYGPATAPQLATLLLEQATGVRMQDIPYKGSAQAATALLSAEVECGYDTVASLAPHLRAGKLRALATPGPQRIASLPEVPTLAELHWPAASFEGWYALALPARSPAAIVERLNRVLRDIMGEPGLQAQLSRQGLQGVFVDAAALRQTMGDEITRFKAVAARHPGRFD